MQSQFTPDTVETPSAESITFETDLDIINLMLTFNDVDPHKPMKDMSFIDEIKKIHKIHTELFSNDDENIAYNQLKNGFKYFNRNLSHQKMFPCHGSKPDRYKPPVQLDLQASKKNQATHFDYLDPTYKLNYNKMSPTMKKLTHTMSRMELPVDEHEVAVIRYIAPDYHPVYDIVPTISKTPESEMSEVNDHELFWQLQSPYIRSNNNSMSSSDFDGEISSNNSLSPSLSPSPSPTPSPTQAQTSRQTPTPTLSPPLSPTLSPTQSPTSYDFPNSLRGSPISSTIPMDFFSSMPSSPASSYYSSFGFSHKRDESPMREKVPSIFEYNGLFIKKDHPLFSQVFSRKVFVGGLPRDISIECIKQQFRAFGTFFVDWPNRDNEVIPPNGFAFLHFDTINSVENLYGVVSKSKSHNKFTLSSYGVKSKDVEVKFWRMKDCEFFFEGHDRNTINTSFTVFVGALPRILTAVELALFMERAFSNVVYSAIDVDLVYGYPKGAGRVTFKTNESFRMALNMHYMDMQLGQNGKKKIIEIKPFLLVDQNCDICSPERINKNAHKYCYNCDFFVCENCELNKSCAYSKHHNLVGRASQQYNE